MNTKEASDLIHYAEKRLNGGDRFVEAACLDMVIAAMQLGKSQELLTAMRDWFQHQNAPKAATGGKENV